MPMYEYRCDSCSHTFERYSPGKSVKTGGVCVKCGKGEVKKVFSTFASNCSGSGEAAAPGPSGCGGGNSSFS